MSIWLGVRKVNNKWKWLHDDNEVTYSKFEMQDDKPLQTCAIIDSETFLWTKWNCFNEFYTICRRN